GGHVAVDRRPADGGGQQGADGHAQRAEAGRAGGRSEERRGGKEGRGGVDQVDHDQGRDLDVGVNVVLDRRGRVAGLAVAGGPRHGHAAHGPRVGGGDGEGARRGAFDGARPGGHIAVDRRRADGGGQPAADGHAQRAEAGRAGG